MDNTLQKQILIDTLAAVKDTSSRAAKIAKSLMHDLLQHEDQCTELQRQLSHTELSDRTSLECEATVEDVYAAIRRAGNALYAISSTPPDQGLLSDPAAEETRHYELLLPIDQIQAFLERDAIYIRTPMLCSMQNKKLRRGQPVERCIMYRDAVQHAIMLAPGYADYSFSRYREKLILYLFVYASAYEQHIDNDNHLTKHVTDGITHLLPGGDSALRCSFYYSALVNGTIPPGTYITVIPKHYGMQSEESIVRYWRDKLQNQQLAPQ